MKTNPSIPISTTRLAAGRWLVFLVLLTAAGMPAAEPVATAWVRRFNGHVDSQDYARAMVSDPFGNVVVAGTTDARFAGGDWFIIKYSSAGVHLWTNRFNGPGNSDDQARAVAMDVSGNVFVTGESRGSDGSYDFATVAYSGEGVPLWTNRYDGPENGYDQPNAVAVDNYSGNVFVMGVSENSVGDSADYVTVAYSGAGMPLWTNRYHGPANDYDYPTALAVDLIGNVFVTGKSYGGTNTYYDFATVAYSAWGVPLWTNRYDGTNVVVGLTEDGEPDGDDNDYANAIAVDSGGNVFVTGRSAGDFATVAYSGAGVPLWTNRYDSPGAEYYSYDGARAIAVDGSGNVVVTGYSYPVGAGTGDDYTTIMYSGAGVPLWTNRYNGPPLPNYSGNDAAVAVAVDGSGNVFVTGLSSGISGDVDPDYLTIKYSSAGVPLWTNRYNGTGNSIDDVQAIAVDGSGNVFVTGSSIGSGSYDCLTIKYSGAGVPLWTNRYEGGPANSFDQPNAVVVDGHGNVFVTGYSGGYGYGYGDYTTLKYSSAGVPLWTNFYSGSANSFDQATAMAVDGNGNVVVTGISRNIGNYVSDFVTIKYSSAGVSLWTNHYNGLGNGYDQANAVAVDSHGNVIVTGHSTPLTYQSGGVNFATIKYSGAGVPLWTNRFAGGADVDEPKAVAVDAAGNVFVTGSSYPPGGGSPGYATVAYSSAGVPLWTNRYFGLGNSGNNANAIGVDASGNVFVTGGSSSIDTSWDYATIKYSGTGVPLWTNRYGSAHQDLANALAVDASGNVVVTGSSGSGETSDDYATIKYSGAGVPLWTNRYSSPGYGEDSANAVAVDSRGDVFVTGQSAVGDGSFDYATIKYSRAGVPLWTNLYNGPANGPDSPLTKQSLALGTDGSVYVTGSSDGDATDSVLGDFATIKYVSPVLAIRRSGADVVVSWPSPFSDFTLQQNTNTSGIATPDWSSVTTSVEDDGANRAVTVSPATGTRFYRLSKP